jgi:hypothetical protein
VYVLYTSTPAEVAVLDAAEAMEDPVEDGELNEEKELVTVDEDSVEVEKVVTLGVSETDRLDELLVALAGPSNETEDEVDPTELVLASDEAADPSQAATQ